MFSVTISRDKVITILLECLRHHLEIQKICAFLCATSQRCWGACEQLSAVLAQLAGSHRQGENLSWRDGIIHQKYIKIQYISYKLTQPGDSYWYMLIIDQLLLTIHYQLLSSYGLIIVVNSLIAIIPTHHFSRDGDDPDPLATGPGSHVSGGELHGWRCHASSSVKPCLWAKYLVRSWQRKNRDRKGNFLFVYRTIWIKAFGGGLCLTLCALMNKAEVKATIPGFSYQFQCGSFGIIVIRRNFESFVNMTM